MDERAALRGLLRREEQALSWLIRRYGAYVNTIVYHILGTSMNAADVEEVASDVFLALWQNAQKVQPDKLKAYLGAIARNKAQEWEEQVWDWFEKGENQPEPGMKGDKYAQNQAFSPEAKETLDKILEKYGLSIYEIVDYPDSQQALYEKMGVHGFLPPAGESGPYSTGGRLFADMESMEEWMYSTKDGATVLLALGEKTGVLAANWEGCFLFVHIRSEVDREMLEAFAEGFDFTAMQKAIH